jgi:D-tyrosyl-tRNA(Tyr) deacylase
MRVVVQRVTSASVTINDSVYSSIGKGLFVFLGIENNDGKEDIEWLCPKLINLRIFNDENGVMNLSVKDIHGEFLVISQFTLHALTKKGNRPSYIRAAKHELAIPLYQNFLDVLAKKSMLTIKAGQFAADMKVSLLNDGPVTILIDTKNKE